MSGKANFLNFATIGEACKLSVSSLVNRVRNFSLSEFEESVVGKNGNRMITEGNEKAVSSSIIAVSLVWAAVMMGDTWRSARLELNLAGKEIAYADYLAIIVLLVSLLALWVTITGFVKLTWRKTRSTALLGIATVWITFLVVRGLGHFVLVEADWEVVWANRILVLVGQQMTEQMTQSPGSPQCLDLLDCYGINQNFRLWWSLYAVFAVVGAAYGTTGEKPLRFLIPFAIVVIVVMSIAWNSTEINYHREVPITRLAIATLIAYASFGASYYYCSTQEEYKAKRLRSYLTIAAVLTFFFSLIIMDPPEFVKSLAELLGGSPAQSMREDIISGAVVPTTLDKLAGDGIET